MEGYNQSKRAYGGQFGSDDPTISQGRWNLGCGGGYCMFVVFGGLVEWLRGLIYLLILLAGDVPARGAGK